jgi:hypothetical protein
MLSIDHNARNPSFTTLLNALIARGIIPLHSAVATVFSMGAYPQIISLVIQPIVVNVIRLVSVGRFHDVSVHQNQLFYPWSFPHSIPLAVRPLPPIQLLKIFIVYFGKFAFRERYLFHSILQTKTPPASWVKHETKGTNILTQIRPLDPNDNQIIPRNARADMRAELAAIAA